MEEIRSSKQQFKDELDAMYLRMTDPEEQEKERKKKQREQQIKESIEDFGL